MSPERDGDSDSDRRQDGTDSIGQVIDGEVVPSHGQVPFQQADIRSGEPGIEFGHVVEAEPLEPEGGQLFGHRVVADDQRPTVSYGLQARVAEPLPGGGKSDHVARLIGVVDVHRPVRSGSTGQVRDTPGDGALCCGHEVFELGAVAVLGRAEQPVSAVQAGG